MAENTPEQKQPQEQKDYGFDKLQTWINLQAEKIQLDTLAKDLAINVKLDFDELKGQLDKTGDASLDVKKTELIGKFAEADILFRDDVNSINQALLDQKRITRQELLDFANNVDDEFTELVNEASETESFAYQYVKDFLKEDDKGETTVFGIKLVDAVKLLQQFGVSMGWLKKFVPEIATKEVQASRKELEKDYKNVTKGLGEKHLTISEVKFILEKRDDKLVDATDKSKITNKSIVKEYYDKAIKNFGTEADLRKACTGDKLSFKELRTISEADSTDFAEIKAGNKTLQEFLAGTKTITEKVKDLTNKKDTREIVEIYNGLSDALKLNYLSEFKNVLGTALGGMVTTITANEIKINIGTKVKTIKILEVTDGQPNQYSVAGTKCLNETALKENLKGTNKTETQKIAEVLITKVMLKETAKEDVNASKMNVEIGSIGNNDLKMSIPQDKDLDTIKLESDWSLKIEMNDFGGIDERVFVKFEKDASGKIVMRTDPEKDFDKKYKIKFENKTIIIEKK